MSTSLANITGFTLWTNNFINYSSLEVLFNFTFHRWQRSSHFAESYNRLYWCSDELQSFYKPIIGYSSVFNKHILLHYVTFLICCIFFSVFLIYLGRHKFFNRITNDWIIKSLGMLISLKYLLNFFILPWTFSHLLQAL